MVELGDAASVTRRYLQLNFAPDAAVEGARMLPAGGEGDGSAFIVDTWFQVDDGRRSEVLEHGQGCAVCMRVRFRRDVSDPVFAFSIADEQHRRVFAVSSEWDGTPTGSFRAGEEVHVAVSFDNWFAPGRYFAASQVAHAGTGLKLMDHREDGASVVVTGRRAPAGVVDIPHAFHVSSVERWADPTVSGTSA
jgi:hypothetical protein